MYRVKVLPEQLSEAIPITRVIRRMRGQSQAYLVSAQDGRYYVAKFQDNPAGTRTLINEWIAHHMLDQLGVSTPALCILNLSDAVRAESNLTFHFTNCEVPVKSGLHLGSLCPVDPDKEAIFDFLPNRLLPNVVNLGDFASTLVLDIYVGQTDKRQVIFTRDRTAGMGAFCAHMIDHGNSFGGSAWQIWTPQWRVSPRDRDLYGAIDTRSICARAVNVLLRITQDELWQVAQEIPRAWISDHDCKPFDHLISSLVRKQSSLALLVDDRLAMIGLTPSGSRFRQSLENPAECCPSRPPISSAIRSRVVSKN